MSAKHLKIDLKSIVKHRVIKYPVTFDTVRVPDQYLYLIHS